jgi:Helix-turn-helix domain
VDSDKLHDVPSAAEWLGGVSTWSVRAWLSQGRLRRVKVGRRTMIWESELMRFVGYQEPAKPQK